MKDEPFGVEFAELVITDEHLTASGVAIGGAQLPYRIDYDLETRQGFVTSRLHVNARGEGWGAAPSISGERMMSGTSAPSSTAMSIWPLPAATLRCSPARSTATSGSRR